MATTKNNFLGREKRVHWKRAVAGREALYNFHVSFFATATGGGNALQCSTCNPPTLYVGLHANLAQRRNGNGVTDVRVGSCATAATCTTNATPALFTYRSQEGSKIGIDFPPASSSLYNYKAACLLSKPLLGLLLACAALHNHVSCFQSILGFLSTCSSKSSLLQSLTGTSSPTVTTMPV